MATKFHIDDGQFFKAVDGLVDQTGLEVKEILRLTGRHLVETLLKVTPPHSGNVGKAHREGAKAQRDAGRKTLNADISRVIGVLKELKLYQDPKIRKLINKQDFKALSKIVGRPVASNIPNDYHEQFRNRRGRINKSTGKQLFVINKGAKSGYVNKQATRIGFYKSGWNAAAKRLKARGNRGWYGWVKAQGGTGRIRDRSSKVNFPNQGITIVNMVDYATESKDASRWMRYSMNMSISLMNKYFKKRLKFRMEKAMKK